MLPAPIRQLLICLLLASSAGAQTAAIEYKSHSGTPSGLAGFLADADADFGRVSPSRRHPASVHLDSVVLLSDSTALAVTATYDYRPTGGAAPRRMSARTDTLRFLPAPAQHRSPDSLRRRLPVKPGVTTDSTRYVGFERAVPVSRLPMSRDTSTASVLLPAAGNDDPSAPVGLPGVLLVAAALAAGLTGFITWLYRRMPLPS
ncbi:hypothetical protein [Flaviaesturariibacter amylovorans]|uniref:Uncharacterized protein n=1 Tax=Flaviaesturariibacter amylovorans TaxID=1084520 RepID=A0ABP8H9F8_9BACT